MTTLNITYQGQSADYELSIDHDVSDAEIRRIAVEVVRSGGARGLYIPTLPNDAFASYRPEGGTNAMGGSPFTGAPFASPVAGMGCVHATA